jgi:hypothetical protein
MTSTWKFSSVGLTNVIPLPKGGGPYTVTLDKQSGAYTGQLYWSPNLDASPQDDSWKTLTDLNTTDESLVLDNDDVRAIMGSITVRPTPVLDKGIYTPIAKFEIGVVPTNSRGANQKQRHASGYGSNLIAGAAPVQDEYAALVLADMGVVAGSFWSAQGGNVVTITDEGPSGIDIVDAGGGVSIGAGPWEGSQAMESSGTGEFTNASWSANAGDGQEMCYEVWMKMNSAPASVNIMEGGVGAILALRTVGVAGTSEDSTAILEALTVAGDDLADPGTWIASTAYVVGDRVRAVADNSRVAECTIAGTSGASEPTWPIDGTTVTDGGTLEWVDCGLRQSFHDLNGPAQAPNGVVQELDAGANAMAESGRWYHLVAQRTSLGWQMFLDGQLVDERLIASVTGSAGTPPRMEFSSVSYECTRIAIGSGFGGSNALNGSWAYAAHYHRALTPAEVLSHYNKGVELGL